MKNLISAAAITLLLLTGPSMAAPTSADLDGALKGTVLTPATGDIELIDNNGHQFIKFGEKFSVASQAETEVRHVDAKTGKVTFLGYLVSKKGYQIYEVPENLRVDKNDRIVFYSALHAEDIATVKLTEE